MAIEYFGSLTKEEHVTTLDADIAPNTWVLENVGPYPGYYHVQPDTKLADSFFLVTSQWVPMEKIMRITQKVKRNSGIGFEGSSADFYLNNNHYFAIRIRGLEKRELLNELQCYYRDAGIDFAKQKKVEGQALIHIKKVFRLESVTSEIYKDVAEEIYYLLMDRHWDWTHFKKLTEKVRLNVDTPVFDAAQAMFYSYHLHDSIRIFSDKLDLPAVEKIHQRYIELMDKNM
jgi:hypothetical protein